MEDTHIIQPKVSETEAVANEIAPKATSTDSDMGLLYLQGVFDITLPAQVQKEQLKWIYDFYEKQGVSDINDVMYDIQDIRNRIGSPPFGVSVLSHTYQYLKVLSQMTQLEKIKQGFEK